MLLGPRLRGATIVSDLFAENCHILWVEGASACVVVDPGLNPERVLDALREQGLVPAAILVTHGHADHIAGNAALKEAYPGAPLVVGRIDAPKLTDPWLNLSAPFDMPLTSPPADRLVDPGDRLEFGDLEFEVRLTPGHSSGHVVFVWTRDEPYVVVGGDVLFAGSVGRADFPDGDFDQLLTSIRRQLYTLPDDTIVLTGHGPATTIGEERRHNPFTR